jgi:hypothetical protein
MAKTDLNNDYYMPFPVVGAQIPSLIVSPDADLGVDLDLEMDEPLNLKLIEFEFNELFKKPVIGDVFFKAGDIIISEKLYNELHPLEIDGIQMIPSTIYDPKNKNKYEGYYFIHNYNHINCLDKNQAVYTKDVLGMVEIIKKMVLNNNILSKISLEERLIFRLGELYTLQLVHKTIMDKIMENEPRGIRFVNVKDFNMGSMFDKI